MRKYGDQTIPGNLVSFTLYPAPSVERKILKGLRESKSHNVSILIFLPSSTVFCYVSFYTKTNRIQGPKSLAISVLIWEGVDGLNLSALQEARSTIF